MTTFDIIFAADFRGYGRLAIEADTIEEAQAKGDEIARLINDGKWPHDVADGLVLSPRSTPSNRSNPTMTYTFKSDGDLYAVINALNVAAERYDEHVKTMSQSPAFERLSDQFRRQAADARRLADELNSI